jgi:hypothetical protein
MYDYYDDYNNIYDEADNYETDEFVSDFVTEYGDSDEAEQ